MEAVYSGYWFIGDIPGDWRVARLDTLANLFGRIGWQGLTSDEYQEEGAWLVTGTDFHKGSVNWDTCVHVPEHRWEEAVQIQLQEGDLLITKDGTIGKLAIIGELPGHASLNSGVMRIASKAGEYVTRFLYYVLRSEVFRSWFKDINAGASTIQHLFQGDFKHFLLPFPTLVEQERISSFLDVQIFNLDEEISILEKQAETLERYKASIVHEAVTKGLDETVRTKPSGVEWIGDIPVHWSMSRLRYLTSFQSGATPSKDDLGYWDEDIPWVSSMEVKADVIKDTSLHISKEAVGSCSTRLLPAGTLVMVVRSGILQHTIPVAILGASMTINQDIKAMRFGGDMLAKYFFYFVRGNNDNLLKVLMKDKSTVDNISLNYLMSLNLPVPPIEEQKKIVARLDEKTNRIDKVLELKRRQTEVLQKRRESLIYEYVTGKCRVKEEA